MATKLTTEILTAALAGFEEQKKRIDAQIADLRQMSNGPSTDGATPEASNPDAKCPPRPGDGLLRHNGNDGLLPETNREGRQKLYPHPHERSAN